MKRRDLFAAVAGALAASALAGGVAWAAIPDGDGVISGCYGKVGGVLRVIDTSRNERCLNGLEVPINWNQKGLRGDPGANGANGVSPTVAQLDAGNANCPAGGAAITDSSGSTAYVCSGANGQDGTNGQDGADGQSFTGSFTSPNGQFSISVSDTGIVLGQPGGTFIQITGSDLTQRSTGTASIHSSGAMSIRGSVVSIN